MFFGGLFPLLSWVFANLFKLTYLRIESQYRKSMDTFIKANGEKLFKYQVWFGNFKRKNAKKTSKNN